MSPLRQIAAMAGLVSAVLAINNYDDIGGTIPHLTVPACPEVGTTKFFKSVPNKGDFPLTQIDVCYTDTHLAISFTAYNETSFYYNPKDENNDDLSNYEVVQALIAPGFDDPSKYFEFQASPNDVTYNAMVYNPSKKRAKGAVFDRIVVSDPKGDGFGCSTEIDRDAELWKSKTMIPLETFDIAKGTAVGTRWRFNFFRTVVCESSFPEQELGAWSNTGGPNIHVSEFFGHAGFI